MKLKIFISSVQNELKEERRSVKDFIIADPLLSRFIDDVFLFEDVPAGDRRPDNLYLSEVEGRDLYLAILGNLYGRKNKDGKSPTELEFEQATRTRKERLVFIKGSEDKGRKPEMIKLINKAGKQLTRRRFTDTPGLIRMVYSSLVDCLDARGLLLTTPFDDSICERANLQDIDNQQVVSFIETAESKGRLTLKGSRSPKAVLQNFNLLRNNKPTNAAVLLFGKNPRQFFNNIQVHCFHYFGRKKGKPFASQQPYEGRLLEVIDQAVEFVLGKLNRSVGTRAVRTEASGGFEIPRSVVTEAIVNAVIHRNYRHNGFVQVNVFSDRVEIWNPGELPTGLTPEMLREPHGPIPRNPLIAEPLFRVNYVEKAGTGTTDMIADCLKSGLPEPDFEQRGPHFVVTLWRDWLTDEVVAELELNERQKKAIDYVKNNKRISNADYQSIANAIKKTASRDLDYLVHKGIFLKVGKTGRGTHYILAQKGDKKGTKGTFTNTNKLEKGTKRGWHIRYNKRLK